MNKEKEVVERYKNGEKVHTITRDLHIGTNTFYKILDRKNVKLKGTGSPKDYNKNYLKPTFNFGYFLGSLFSDGNIDKHSIRWCGLVNQKWAVNMKNLFENIYNIEVKIRSYKRHGKQFDINLNSTNLTKEIKELTNNKEKIPEIAKSGKCFYGFLSGFIDGDGTINKKERKRIIISNTKFLQPIKKVLENIDNIHLPNKPITGIQLHITKQESFEFLKDKIKLLHPKKSKWFRYHIKNKSNQYIKRVPITFNVTKKKKHMLKKYCKENNTNMSNFLRTQFNNKILSEIQDTKDT